MSEIIKPIELADVPGKPINKTHWGYHLLLDASGCNKNIDDPDMVKLFLKMLVKELDMKPIGEPTIIKVSDQEGRGVTGVQVITTSTITFHGDDQEWCVYLDVFSCKTYDPRLVFKLFTRFFKPKHYGYKWILRDAGKWPK